MSIGNCDNCDRRNVPRSPGEASGAEGWFCYICWGHDDPDPYCELDVPARCTTNLADYRGECIKCGAWSGEACLSVSSPSQERETPFVHEDVNRHGG